MAEYSATDKILHRLYLGNYFLSTAALEVEEIIHGANAKKQEIEQCIFITGLARSGTTAVMNKIFETAEYASLQYSNMPFILNPNIWKRKSKIQSHERAHNDGIIIDGNSPEEFDEYFWKSQLKDSYIQEDGLIPHTIDQKVLDKYITYLKLICLAKGKRKYISKNNNNILRLGSLQKIEGHKIVLLFRDPVSHASSLLKLHNRFSAEQKEESFTLEYFNYLGHHEFGLNHKPFLLTNDFDNNRELYAVNSLNYWLAVWLNYYQYALDQINEEVIIISFEDLVADPSKIYAYLQRSLSIGSQITNLKSHIPSKYPDVDVDPTLLEKCKSVYNKMGDLKKY